MSETDFVNNLAEEISQFRNCTSCHSYPVPKTSKRYCQDCERYGVTKSKMRLSVNAKDRLKLIRDAIQTYIISNNESLPSKSILDFKVSKHNRIPLLVPKWTLIDPVHRPNVSSLDTNPVMLMTEIISLQNATNMVCKNCARSLKNLVSFRDGSRPFRWIWRHTDFQVTAPPEACLINKYSPIQFGLTVGSTWRARATKIGQQLAVFEKQQDKNARDNLTDLIAFSDKSACIVCGHTCCKDKQCLTNQCPMCVCYFCGELNCMGDCHE